MIFDYCSDCTKLPQPLTQEQFETLIRQPWLATLAKQIAEGDLAKKRSLPAACWQARFNGNKRANQNAQSSGLFALDVDHVEDPLGLYESFKGRIDELGIYIVHKTPSTKGIRVVATCREQFSTIGENQAWIAHEIGVDHDAATHDFARLSFLVPESYFYYYNPLIFSDKASVELSNPNNPAATDLGSQSQAEEAQQAQSRQAANATPADAEAPQQCQVPDTGLEFRGIPYKDIVEELVARTGGEPYEGERNNRLYLICRLLANITDRQADRLFRVCPRFGLTDAEVRACCESACKSARTEKLPYVLYKVLRDFGFDPSHPNDTPKEDDDIDMEPLDDAEPTPSDIRMPEIKHLPPLIREFVETSPTDFQPATAMACLPICGFLGSRLRARYSDGEIQAPSFIVNVIAPAASGKSTFLRIADICLAKVRQQDDEGREQEAEYARQAKLKKNEKKQLEEPQPIVRDIPAKVSVAQLLKRMVQAQGLHLISVSSEADTLTNSNKAGVWAQKSDIYRIAQDCDGGRYGQDYKSDVSFSATCKMRYNLLTLGTPGAIARAYPDVEDGLISRCIMVELPSQFGKAMPIRKKLTPNQMRIINEKVAALMAICQDEQGNVLPEYHMSLPWLCEGINSWVSQQRIRAIRDDDHARDQFMRRAALIGFRAGMVASFLWGRPTKERKAYTIEFALWVASCILQSLLDRYSVTVNQQAHSYEAPKAKRFPSLFEAMPDIFTQKELRKACIAQGMKSPLKTIIFRWTENGLITKQGDSFVKLTM